MRVMSLMLVFGVLFGSACSKSNDGTSRIRVENRSDKTFDAVTIWGVDHGPLQPGAISQYTLVDVMYDKVSVTVTIDTLQFSQTVIDYVGEEPIRSGDFTLQVGITDLSSPGSITQNLVRD